MADQVPRRSGKPISASEIGQFLYCERSWWYGRQGEPSHNLTELQRGTRRHAAFARRARRLEWAARWARVLVWIILALILLVLALKFGVGLL